MREDLPLGKLQRDRQDGIIELGLTQKTSQTLIPLRTLRLCGSLMIRRQLSEKLFDAEPGWLGPKYLKGFFAQSDWEQRVMMIQQARNGGSMTPA